MHHPVFGIIFLTLYVSTTKSWGRQLPGMLVKRKLQYFGHLMRKTEDNVEKDIITGSIPGNRRSQRKTTTSWINDITDWTDMSTNKVLQMVWDREYWRDIVHHAYKVRNDEQHHQQQQQQRQLHPAQYSSYFIQLYSFIFQIAFHHFHSLHSRLHNSFTHALHSSSYLFHKSFSSDKLHL